MSYNREETEKTEIANLNPSSRRVDVTVKILSKNPVREVVSRNDGATHRVTEALAGDQTGVILLTLWDEDIEKTEEGNVYEVKNGYVNLFRGSMRLNIGRYGQLELSEETIDTVKTENNLSDKVFEDRRRGGFRRPSYGRGWS